MAFDTVSDGIDLFDALNPAQAEVPQGKLKRRAERRAAFFRHRGSDCADALRRPHFKDVRDPPLVIAAREAAMVEAAEGSAEEAEGWASWWWEEFRPSVLDDGDWRRRQDPRRAREYETEEAAQPISLGEILMAAIRAKQRSIAAE